jgi:uncharacterized protein YjiS (DUF1127 family)
MTTRTDTLRTTPTLRSRFSLRGWIRSRMLLREIRQLESLDDHLLKDIGLTRGDVAALADSL